MEPVRILDDTETEFIGSETSDHGFISANISFAMSQNLPPTAPESDSPGTRAVERSIAAYTLGDKLRKLRLRKKISLVDLGKHTGLSPSMLSQLENGKLVPTLPTLTHQQKDSARSSDKYHGTLISPSSSRLLRSK
mgnify:CR=1 FL=1